MASAPKQIKTSVLIVTVPVSFLPEREYIVNCLLGEFLGLEFELKTSVDQKFYRITFNEGMELLIRDAFFSGFSETEGYLNRLNIPDNVNCFKESFPEYYDTPVIYGKNEIHNVNGKLICEADIFSSAFFMLSRWEEYVIRERDEHNRFPGDQALSVRKNFHNRPVVDEYTEILWFLLCKAGYKGERKRRQFRIIPTHDIDRLIYWDKKKKNQVLKNIAGDLFKRKNLKTAFHRGLSYCKALADNSKDPCLRFENFMELAERRGTKANFYFIAGKHSPYDPEKYINTFVFTNELSLIKKRGHIIGIHPSYESFNNLQMLWNEINELREASQAEILSGRQHYLRHEVPLTWRLWDECNLETDSSMYYSGYPGFRCGTSHQFPVFDIIGRKTLRLREMPLLVMDTCLYKLKPDLVVKKIRDIKAQVKKHNGNFVFVWHNCLNLNMKSGTYNKIFEEEFYE